MGYTIAVAGKGGTGKTTITSLFMRVLGENKTRVLGIDADPNSNLADSFGLKIKEDIGSIIDSISKNPNIVPQGMSKETYIDYCLQTSIIEENNFDILTMGRPEGPGCYCYVNNLLRGLIKKISDSYDYIVIDNEAGFEHLSRKTMRRAENLFLISDLSEPALRATKRIFSLVKELNLDIKNISIILNRAPGGLTNKDLLDGMHLAGAIPEDKQILELSRAGKPITLLDKNSEALRAIRKILLDQGKF